MNIKVKKQNYRKSGIQEARREKRRREAFARQAWFEQLTPEEKALVNPRRAEHYLGS